jgi:hypothetical protein
MNTLSGTVQPIATLSADDIGAMVSLMVGCYQNVTEPSFLQDLREKESVILLRDPLHQIQGFSTLMRLHTMIEGNPITAFFSGDTIIAPAFWGETVLPRLWARHVFALAEALDEEAYWFLISSGYKTYRFLPVFFRDFYPTYQSPTPPRLQCILDTFAIQKFEAGYNPANGIVRLDHATPLRPAIAEVDHRRLHDPHVAFFDTRNPKWGQGEELACITRIHPDNLTPAGRRMLFV